MPEFESKKVNTETLPEYLKAARESLSYDLRTVSHISGISEKFIADLENGYYHRLPSDVYVMGFLKKLSEIYNCDSSWLISEFKKEKEIYQNIHKYASGQKYPGREWKSFAITPRTITIIISIILVLAILGYLGYQVKAANTPPRITVSQPINGATINSSSTLLSGHVDPGSKLAVNGQNIYVDGRGNFNQMISVNPGQNSLDFQAQSNFGKTSTKEVTIIANYQPDNTQPQNPSAVSLIVTVGPNSTWISVQQDNGQAEQYTFLAGSSKTYTAQNKILLSTGDAGSTSISLNGKNLGRLGKEGEILRDIPFTTDNVLAPASTSGSTQSTTPGPSNIPPQTGIPQSSQ